MGQPPTGFHRPPVRAAGRSASPVNPGIGAARPLAAEQTSHEVAVFNLNDRDWRLDLTSIGS
jgi:hypothetical protein